MGAETCEEMGMPSFSDQLLIILSIEKNNLENLEI